MPRNATSVARFAVELVLAWLWIDMLAYYIHRLFHSPRLYKAVHKWHHRYRAPTMFAAIAMHPLEVLWRAVQAPDGSSLSMLGSSTSTRQ